MPNRSDHRPTFELVDPAARMHARGKRVEMALTLFRDSLAAAVITGHPALANRAAHFAADVLADERPRDGWPFYVRAIQALDGAGLLPWELEEAA